MGLLNVKQRVSVNNKCHIRVNYSPVFAFKNPAADAISCIIIYFGSLDLNTEKGFEELCLQRKCQGVCIFRL